MRVTILGSGTAVPEADRFPAGVLVEAGDETVLVDAGPGVVRRLAGAGVTPDRVTTVLLTHYHPDHCADLVALLFALRNPAFAGRPRLRVLGGPGLHDLLRTLRTAWPWIEARGYELEEREIGPGSFALDGVEVTAVPVVHTSASLAYRLEEDGSGAAVAISGDTDSTDGLVEAARDVDVFVCEAAFPASHRGDGHISAADAGRAARDAGARLLCLTHIYPLEWAGQDPVAEAREEFAGRIELARDLLRLDVERGGGGIDVRPPPGRA